MNKFDPHYVPTKAFALVGQKALIFNQAGKFLLLKRSSKTSQGGKWSLAGGALEDREDPFTGIQREITEETKLNVRQILPYSIFSYTNEKDEFVVMIGYRCVAVNESVVLNWEHDEYKWVTKEKALEMDLTSHAQFFIDNFQS